MRPAGEHRKVQQPALRQEQKRRVRARGQLPAERAGPARGPAGGLPLQLRDVAGARSVLSADPVGGSTAEPVAADRGRRQRRWETWLWRGPSRAGRSHLRCGFIPEISQVSLKDEEKSNGVRSNLRPCSKRRNIGKIRWM